MARKPKATTKRKPGRAAQIYGLFDPVTGELRYIGKAKCAETRFKGHMRDKDRRDYPVYRWIRKLGAQGHLPIVQVLEEAKDWKKAERRLIEVSRARGDRLLNVAAGGDEPHCSPEVRSANARKLNESLKADSVAARLRALKCQLGRALREGYICNASRAKLRALASKDPKRFGIYQSLPDRAE